MSRRMLVVALASLLACVHAQASAGLPTVPSDAFASADGPPRAAEVALGHALFFDTRLSATRTVACVSCHDVVGAPGRPASGADGLPMSRGVHGLVGSRNAPTVWNAGQRGAFFWDGRVRTLEVQAGGPLTNPVEMGMRDLDAVAAVVDSIAGYRERFRALRAPHDPGYHVRGEDVVRALAEYERTLVTPDSPFDRFQRGDSSALGVAEKRGWQRFREIGCVGCHGAPTFTGSEFFVRFPQRPIRDLVFLLGLTRDEGRVAVTHQRADANRWRVPSLRNVAVTGPYFHNGSVPRLEQAIRLMGKAQVGVTLADDDVRDLAAFLGALTGVPKPQAAPPLPR